MQRWCLQLPFWFSLCLLAIANTIRHWLVKGTVPSALHMLNSWSSWEPHEKDFIFISIFQFVVVQVLSCVWFFVTPWTAAHQASLSFTIFWSLPKFMSIESVLPSNHLILCHPLLLLPSVFLSIRVFSNESSLHIRWPKYWSFSFSINPSNEYSGLIFFRIDRFDLLAVQGTLKSLLQYHNSKASILQCSFFTVQVPHSYLITGKTIVLVYRKTCLMRNLYAGQEATVKWLSTNKVFKWR